MPKAAAKASSSSVVYTKDNFRPQVFQTVKNWPRDTDADYERLQSEVRRAYGAGGSASVNAALWVKTQKFIDARCKELEEATTLDQKEIQKKVKDELQDRSTFDRGDRMAGHMKTVYGYCLWPGIETLGSGVARKHSSDELKLKGSWWTCESGMYEHLCMPKKKGVTPSSGTVLTHILDMLQKLTAPDICQAWYLGISADQNNEARWTKHKKNGWHMMVVLHRPETPNETSIWEACLLEVVKSLPSYSKLKNAADGGVGIGENGSPFVYLLLMKEQLKVDECQKAVDVAQAKLKEAKDQQAEKEEASRLKAEEEEEDEISARLAALEIEEEGSSSAAAAVQEEPASSSAERDKTTSGT